MTPTDSARRFAARASNKAVRVAAAQVPRLRRALPEPAKQVVRRSRRFLPGTVVRAIDRAAGRPSGPQFEADFAAGSVRPPVPDTPVRVWVAPANFAAQGWAWSRALEAHVPGVGARCMAVRGGFHFPVDQEVAREVYLDVVWQRAQEAYVLENYTHVLIEAGRPVFGTRYGNTIQIELRRLAEAGRSVALISHGSDLRLPSRHADVFPHSPFRDPEVRTTRVLQARAETNGRIMREFDGPTFVSTPDLLDDAPTARWCPTIVDVDAWASTHPLLERPRPRVVHIPSNGPLKGTPYIDAAMTALEQEGLIEYRSLSGISHAELKAEYQQADIVVDQLVMGLYGVASIEAMAAGRVVVAFVGDVVRERVRRIAGREVPICEATPETLADVVRGLVADRDGAHRHAADGVAYARHLHDGRFSAEVLRPFVTP